MLKLVWKDGDPHDSAIQAMYDIQKVHKAGVKADPMEDERCRTVKWRELVCIFEKLERDHGWAAVDGKQFYTQDDKPSHKSNVLGEGWRDLPRREAGGE
jgi:hypothetical protein